MSLVSNDLVTYEQASVLLGVSVPTIRNYVKSGKLPAPVRFGKKPFFRPDEFKAALNQTNK